MKKFTVLFFLLVSEILQAQFSVNNPSALTTEQIVKDILVGEGVSPINIVFNGSATKALSINDQVGFWNTNLNPTSTGFDPLQTGLIMTTGKVEVALGPNGLPNDASLPSRPYGTDADLTLLSGNRMNNVAILEFDFVATGLELNFDFVFGSEEYPEYVGSPAFNDAFGFFLSGPGISGPYSNNAKNIALIPNTNTGVSINNVNSIANSTYYVDNAGGIDLEYDGFTKVMRASSALECGGTYHIKLAIGNAGTNTYDSGVLLKNFTIPPMELVDNYGLTDNPYVCYGETVTISSGITVPDAVFEWSLDGVPVPGNGPDLSVTTGGSYSLNVYTAPPGNCLFALDDITIGYLPQAPVNDPNSISVCTSAPPPYTFDIDQTSMMMGTQSISDYGITYYDSSYLDAYNGVPNGIVSDSMLSNYSINGALKTIWVRIDDYVNGCVEVKTFDLIVNVPPTITGESTVCVGSQSQLTGQNTAAATNAWISSDTAVLTVDDTGLVTAVSIGSTDITYTDSNGCSGGITITVTDLPTATISGDTSVCMGDSAVITFSGTANATVTYAVNGGSNQTITLDASGNQTLTTSSLYINSTYSLISVASSGITSCSQTQTGSVTVNVLDLPTAIVSGTTTVCQNDVESFVTFTGANGIAPYIFTYTINKGALQTVTTISGNSIDVNVPTNISGTFVYELVDVLSSTTPSCAQSQTGTATINVIEAPNAIISYASAAFCVAETTPQAVNLSGTSGGYYTVTPTGLDLNPSTGAIVPSGSAPGVYSITYHVNPSGGCTSYDSDPVNVEILSGPTATISYSGPYCVSYSGQVSVVQTGASGGVYSATPSGLIINPTTGEVTPSSSEPGYYTVTYTVGAVGGCSQLVVTDEIEILDLPNPDIDSGKLCLDPETNQVLPGSTVTLSSGLSTLYFNFEWYDSSGKLVGTESEFTTNVPDEYTLIVSFVGGISCSNSVTMVVDTVYSAKSATATVANYFEDASIAITVMGNETYLYELDNSGVFQESNVFTNVSEGSHTVTIFDVYGCTNIVLTDILIVDFPRFFTPNGDGYNDTWNIKSLADQLNAEIHVFDRYGKLITQLKPSGQGWDGTYKGKDLPSADYWFTIEFNENGLEKFFNSHFSLKR